MATQADEEVAPASVFRAQQDRIRELERLLGRKTMEVEVLKEALDYASDSKNASFGRYRGRKAVPDESGVRDDRRRAVECRGAGGRRPRQGA
jgi:hypothetical protein